MSAMSIDDFLLAIIIAGIGLAVAYLRAELGLHRTTAAAERTRELAQREVHAKRVHLEYDKMPQPVPSMQEKAFRPVRVLARALRIYIQERNIHRFRIRT
jgi:hypothetical protein